MIKGLITVFIISVLIFPLSGVSAYNEKLKITGTTRSMGNLIAHNDYIYVDYVIGSRGERLKIGDIIAIKSVKGNTIHRIIDMGTDNKGPYWITKGDNNTVDDSGWLGKVRRHAIKGIIVKIDKAKS